MAIEIGSLKLNKSHLIFMLLIALAVFLLIDRGGTRSGLKQALKDLKAERNNSTAIQKKADGAIAGYEAMKKESDGKISNLAGSLAATNTNIKKKDSRIAELETALPGLKTKDEIIANQVEQIKEWTGTCAFLEQKVIHLGEPVEENGKLIYPPNSVTFELSRKYDSQFSITGQWIVKFNAVCVERDRGGMALTQALKDLRSERLKSKAKTGAVAIVAGGALYLSGDRAPAYLVWALGLLNLIFGK